ncbi:MAG: SPFH domain-containing protein, partial [Candidatus Kapabacteria bacterium]|nr:SPFH domain-containing protein [Candidatus Kapabacteria bacterium]MBU3700407.1 SPFH domain-containing protein [Candidatus Kapabacteria bacterium]
ESIKSFAAESKGNVIFLDGSAEGMNKTLREMIAMQSLDEPQGLTKR